MNTPCDKTAGIADRSPLVIYAIFKRAKTKAFTKSKMKTKAIVPASTLPSTQIGSGIMSQPQPAKVSALPKSATEDKTSQRLG